MTGSAFDPAEFRATGHGLVDILADYLERAQRGDAMPVLPTVDPDELLAQVSGEFPEDPTDDFLGLLRQLVDRSNHLHHPGYIGHQVATVLPQAALAELTHALLNNGMAVYEMGQLQTVMERRVIEFFARAFGWDDSAGGVMTHGGSLGNLTALLAARQSKSGHDVWTEGQREACAVLVSDQAHYCVARAVQVMGWGADGAIRVATDERFHVRRDALERGMEAAAARGRRVLAVVASSCSTATGSFDPLEEVADFCAEHDLWLHVDGAHGAPLVLSATHAHKLAGIERADSVVCDLHKLMSMPALVTAVLFRDGRKSHEAFAQEASYLFRDADPEREWFDVGRRTLECTKRAMGATAYILLRSLGTRCFREHVDRLVGLATTFAGLVRDAADFELACEPEANIVCFRHTPTGFAGDLDALQGRVRTRVLEAGAFYIVQTALRGAKWLRVTVMNPMTDEARLVALLEEVRQAAGDRAG